MIVMVRISYDDGSPPDFCSVEEFRRLNTECFDIGEEERFAAGERITLGGGAQPVSHVQIIDVDEVIAEKSEACK
jgi:hypothetical protein